MNEVDDNPYADGWLCQDLEIKLTWWLASRPGASKHLTRRTAMEDLRPESWYYDERADLDDYYHDHPHYADHPRTTGKHGDPWWDGPYHTLFMRWGDALTGEMQTLWDELGETPDGDRFDALHAALIEKFEEQRSTEIQDAYIEWCGSERERAL